MNLISEVEENQKSGLAIFASGAGTNAENCIRYFMDHPRISVKLVVSNKDGAGVLEKAAKYRIPSILVSKNDWENPVKLGELFKERNIELIVLAGYLSLLPAGFIESFHGKIINIHPALLPKFGGKGMYGRRVHQAVLENGEKETGISIHEVNEEYDKGKIIFQKKFPIAENETVESIEKKIRELEYYYLPRVIETIILNQK